jgi:triosephosphate isomerase
LSLQQFSQALLTEHFLIVSCEGYRPPENLVQLFQSLENSSKKLCVSLPYASLMKNHELLTSLNAWKGLSDIPSMDPHTFPAQISIRLAEEANIDFAVIGGHTSRQVLYESDHSIAAKLRGLLNTKITPVVCFGETLQDYVRGSTEEVLKEQLSTLLLGLTFDQIIRTVLVYKAPWINTIAPENLVDEYQKSHDLVITLLQHLFGADAASHIALLTNLPWISEDFSKIESALPPSGYFLELGGKHPQMVDEYYHILSETGFKAAPVPFLTLSKTKAVEEPEPAPEKPKKEKKPRKKKEKSVVEVSEIETIVEANETIVGDTIHDSILSVEHELDTPTINFDINEPTTVNAAEDLSSESETTIDEEFELQWYSTEELESLRKEFGIESDGTINPKPVPVWDNTRPVRIIKTQAQKAEETDTKAKPKKKPKK